MSSINEHRIRQRVAMVNDLANGAQGTSKSIKEHIKALQRSVKIEKESMGSAADFNRDVGSI